MFNPEIYKAKFEELTKAKQELERQYRELTKWEEYSFDVKLKHFYITRGEEVTVPLVIKTSIKTESNYDENFMIVERLKSGKQVEYKYYKTDRTPNEGVMIKYNFRSGEYFNKLQIREHWNPEYDQPWFLTETQQLSEGTRAEYEKLSTAHYKEKDYGLPRKILYSAMMEEDNRLKILVRKCNVYLAKVLYEEGLTKVFSQEQLKKIYPMLEDTNRTDYNRYLNIAHVGSFANYFFGKGIWCREESY